jgi:hypothetical protein
MKLLKHKNWTKHELYWTWNDIKKRCYKKTYKSYKWYGANGITMDPRWRDFSVFVADVGAKPSMKYSIDRINNLKGYYKGNIRWATAKEQADNRRYIRECLYGHRWTNKSTLWTHNGVYKTRRCKICLDKYNKDRRAK